MDRLKGKTAVVTGGSLGIGEAACILLAKEGAAVAVTDVLDKEGRELVAGLKTLGLKAEYFHLNVSIEKEVKKVIRDVYDTFGRLDILVNNAGIAGSSKPTHETCEEEWDKVMNVNVKGVFFCTKHAIPFIKKSGGGSIINLSSIYGIISSKDVPAYHASKGAVRMMTKTDALFYAEDKIRVNSLHPGFIRTPMVENYLKSSGNVEEGRKCLNSLHPLGHIGEPDDIAYGILYLASDESKFVTGSELVIDGGYTAK